MIDVNANLSQERSSQLASLVTGKRSDFPNMRGLRDFLDGALDDFSEGADNAAEGLSAGGSSLVAFS